MDDYDQSGQSGQSRDAERHPSPPGVGPTRVFRAAGMREAFARVKAEIGPDAIILGTRDMSRFDADPAQRFEVVAAFPGAVAQRTKELAGRRDESTRAASSPPPLPPLPQLRHEGRAEPTERHLGQLQAAMQSMETQLASVLEANRSMHDELSKLSRARITAEAAAPTTESAALLVAAGVEREVAESLVNRAVRRVSPRRGIAVARPPDLAEEIERTLQVARPLWHQPSGTVCALVGPTGAGKTTTLLKIAGLARYAHGRSVACITTDVDRIGNYEQLALYCEVMGLPLIAAGTRDAVDEALDGLADVDLVLIDTPGHNPFSAETRHAALKPLASREVTQHLVLPATLASSLIADTIECYSGPALATLILTKFDEARGFGALLAAAMASVVPVSHTCDGQDVPDAIQAVDRAQITRELLAQAS